MASLLTLSALIDRFTAWVGRSAAWLALAMVLVGAGNAILRYFSRFAGQNLSSNAALELQWYLFSALFLLAAAYTLQQDRHVRVDVLYGRLGPVGKARIDVFGTLCFLIPFCAFALWVSFPSVRSSWEVRELSPDPGGLPRYPVKTLILVSFWLVLLQGVSQLIKAGTVLLGRDDS